ncbi:MAG TPA: hypothetical protein VFR07_02330 [Mycobacteriales bacterium]|nr:hypothetical protein [Mycobacteriales bacterium]
MSPGAWALTALVLVLLGVYVSWTAGRLDRLHARVDAAWAALDAALVRRAAAARALVLHLPPRAPQTLELERAAAAALVGGPVAREAVENDLSVALRAALPLLPAGGSAEVRRELDAAATRVGLARSFHNSAVANARVLRDKRMPRLLRLAGHRVLPQYFDIDDAALSPDLLRECG